MPVNRWMDKENVMNVYIHICNGILCSHEKEENPTTWDDMHGPGGHYAEWDVRHRKTNLIWYSL